MLALNGIVASATWSIGAVLGALLGTVLLDHAGRTALGTACAITGMALFGAQQRLRRRCAAEPRHKLNRNIAPQALLAREKEFTASKRGNEP